MCFMMDPNLGKYVCYVQFPQRFDGIDRNDRYANRNTVFFDVSLISYLILLTIDVLIPFEGFANCSSINASLKFQINLRGLDGIQGPVYVGTGCVFNRTALYGYEPPRKPKNKKKGLFSTFCGESRKKNSKARNKGSDKKKSSKLVDHTLPIFNLDDIEEGIEGILEVTSHYL